MTHPNTDQGVKGRFTIEDDTFVDVRAHVGGHVYLWQTAPDTGVEAQINLTPDGAYRLGLELIRRCRPNQEGTAQ